MALILWLQYMPYLDQLLYSHFRFRSISTYPILKVQYVVHLRLLNQRVLDYARRTVRNLRNNVTSCLFVRVSSEPPFDLDGLLGFG